MMQLRIPTRALILISSLTALAVLLGALLLFAPQFSGRALAASRTMFAVTCNQQADFAHCNNLDPVQQECATPDTTTISQNIVDPAGTIVGRVDRRFSLLCHTWWGRVFDFRHIKGTFITLQVGDRGYRLPFNAVAYSDMVFDPPNASAPAVTGTLSTNGKPDPALSATIPAA